MKNSKLILFLSQMDKKEWAQFVDFVHSPFFNSNRKSIDLFQCLLKAYPNFEEEKIKKEKLQQLLYGELNAKTESSFAVLTNHLTNLVSTFWRHLELEQHPHTCQIMDLLALSERGLTKHFISRYKEINKEQAKQEKRSIADYGNRYELLTVLQEFNAIHHDETIEVDVQEIADTFYAHSIAQRLYIACIILNKARVKAITYNKEQIEQLLTVVENRELLHLPIIESYYQTLLLLKNEQDENYQALKKILTKAEIPEDELKNLYAYALNYCNKQIVKGNMGYYQEMFELYKTQIEQKLVFEGKYIKLNHARNAVTLALRLSEFVWVKGFIEDCRRQIAPEYSQIIYQLNMAAFHFYQKNTKSYQHCIDHLNKIAKDVEPIYNIERRSLLLKAYYELGEGRLFDSHIETFKSYIKTQKDITIEKKAVYNYFIRLAVKLFDEKSKPNRGRNEEKLEKLKSEISSATVNDKQWLLTKVEELKK